MQQKEQDTAGIYQEQEITTGSNRDKQLYTASYFFNGGTEEDHYPDNNYKRALRYVITLCSGAGRRILLLQEF